MKRINFIILFLCIGQIMNAQNILVREVSSDVYRLDADKVAEKFASVCEDDFSLYGVDLTFTQLQEAEMKALDNRTVLSVDLSIKVFSLVDEQLLGTKSLKLISSAANQNKAQNGLLAQITRKRKAINKILNDIKEEHPPKDCRSIELAIENYITRQAFSEALTLSNISGTDCGERLQDLRIKTYNAYQQNYCDSHLQTAKVYIANMQFDKAVRELVKISPESNCKDGVEALVKELSEKKDEVYSDSLAAYVKYLELARLERSDRLDLIRLLEIKHLLDD